MNNCGGVVRLQCMECGHYFDFCPLSAHKNSVCPNCERYFVNYPMGKRRRFIQDVPYWYGKPVPGWLNVQWMGKFAAIPEHYLNVHMYLKGEKGEAITREDAMTYFRDFIKSYFNKDLKVMSNKEWERLRVDNPENRMLTAEGSSCECSV